MTESPVPTVVDVASSRRATWGTGGGGPLQEVPIQPGVATVPVKIVFSHPDSQGSLGVLSTGAAAKAAARRESAELEADDAIVRPRTRPTPRSKPHGWGGSPLDPKWPRDPSINQVQDSSAPNIPSSPQTALRYCPWREGIHNIYIYIYAYIYIYIYYLSIYIYIYIQTCAVGGGVAKFPREGKR